MDEQRRTTDLGRRIEVFGERVVVVLSRIDETLANLTAVEGRVVAAPRDALAHTRGNAAPSRAIVRRSPSASPATWLITGALIGAFAAQYVLRRR